jgi:hypothetical protein
MNNKTIKIKKKIKLKKKERKKENTRQQVYLFWNKNLVLKKRLTFVILVILEKEEKPIMVSWE